MSGSTGLMSPTALPSGSSTTAYRAPQKAWREELLAPISSTGEVVVNLVYLLSAVDLEPKHPHAARPATVPVAGELLAIEVKVEAVLEVRRPMVPLPGGVGIWDGQAKPPVEGDGSLHVGHNEVELAW